MPESPLQWYARVSATIESDGHRDSDLQQWSSWPWTGDLTAKGLEPPVEVEPPRQGVGGLDCRSCDTGTDPGAGGAPWWDEGWFITWAGSSSLPFAAFLMPRRHARAGRLLQGGEQLTLTGGQVRRQGREVGPRRDRRRRPVARQHAHLVADELVRRVGGRAASDIG